jgi:intracellular septation protein
MKQLVDFLPIVAFVGVYIFTDIFIATGALMVTAVVQLLICKLMHWPISRQMWLIIWVALISGSLTLVFQDKTFIQWKPTILYWVMGCAIVGSRYIGPGNYIQKTLGKALVLPYGTWTQLTWAWGIVMLVAGGGNLYIAYEFSEQAWVSYKLISAFAIPIVLSVATVGYLAITGQLSPSHGIATPGIGAVVELKDPEKQ